MQKIIIAIDGYAASGKSSIGNGVAKHLQYIYINSGILYRAMTLFFKNQAVPLDNALAIEKALAKADIQFMLNPELGTQDIYLNGVCVTNDLYTPAIETYVSQVSSLPLVRNKIKSLQDQFGKLGGIVMDGRDIGTKVFPHAELKIFMTASLAVRTKRKYETLQRAGAEVTVQQVQESLYYRDLADVTRIEGPLRQAEDAILIDTTSISIEAAVKKIVALALIKLNLVLKNKNQVFSTVK